MNLIYIFIKIDAGTVIPGMAIDTLTGKTFKNWSG